MARKVSPTVSPRVSPRVFPRVLPRPSCFVCLRSQNKHKKISVCLSGCTYVDFRWGHDNFRRSQRIQTKFGGCVLCMKSRSGIEIQSKLIILILILILNRILIFTKTLRSDIKFRGYL